MTPSTTSGPSTPVSSSSANGPDSASPAASTAATSWLYTVTNNSNGTSTSHVMEKLTTADVWRADGPFLGTSPRRVPRASRCGLHRGVATSPQNWDNAAAYYPAGALEQLGTVLPRQQHWRLRLRVPYDDVNSQSPVPILTSSWPADGLTITIGH